MLASAQSLPRCIPYNVNGKIGLVDIRKEMVIEPQFTDAFPETRNMVFVEKSTENGRRWGALDPYGKELLPFDYLRLIPRPKVILFQTEAGWGVMSYQKTIIADAQYTNIKGFHENIAVMEKEGKFGYLKLDGQELVPAEYEYAATFGEGRGVMSKDKKQFVFDRYGKLVFEAQYHSMQAFKDDITVFEIDGMYGVVDKNGKIVVLPRYERIYGFVNGLAECKSDGKWGVLYRSGAELIPCEFAATRIVGEWPAAVMNEDK
ncbi:MAG: WG repeat-containing protein [Bacteroidota bacterium]